MTKDDDGKRIGVAGLGDEGAALCRRLQAAGYAVCGYDLDPVRALGYAEQGIGLCPTPAELARCPVVMLTPQSETDIETILFGECGLLSEEPEVLVVDLSLTEPGRVREFAVRAARAGARWVDAYWSGGPAKPRDGPVVILGGLSSDADSAAQVFTTLGCRCVNTGRVGDAHTVGLIETAVTGVQHALANEVGELILASGLNVEDLRGQLNGAFFAEMSILRSCEKAVPGGMGSLRAVRNYAESVEVAVPIISSVLEFRQWARQ